MILRPWQALGAFALAWVLVVAVWPRPGELAGLAEAAGAWGPASRLLERAHAIRPADEALTGRLLAAYEHAGQRDKAMTLLERQGPSRPLGLEERRLARRVGLALGQPRRVLALLTAPNQLPAP
ncbi:MAG: tetratricopeptide repeat protein, partial [Candidatus Sericytochromatia bacterium]